LHAAALIGGVALLFGLTDQNRCRDVVANLRSAKRKRASTWLPCVADQDAGSEQSAVKTAEECAVQSCIGYRDKEESVNSVADLRLER
jgi:hypothetical protein